VHKVDLQPISTGSADQIPVDETVIRINGDDHWLDGAVDPEPTESCNSGYFHRSETDNTMISRRASSATPT